MRSTTRRAAVLTLLAVACCAGLTSASEFTDDLAARRTRAMEQLGPAAMLILRSAPPRTYSLDIDYEYRQDSNLYYLTGMTEEDTILVLLPGNTARREILFVKPRDPVQEHWRGHLMTSEEATARTGIKTVLTTDRFEGFLEALLRREAPPGFSDAEVAPFIKSLTAGNARIALPLETRALNEPLGPNLEFARLLRDRFTGFHIDDAAPLLADMRIIKTPYERTLLKKSVAISNDAQLAGMRAARPGAYEYEVKAAIEAVHRARGAESPAYPSIVGSGPNATTLHYSGGDRQMRAGDLLLVDAAASYQYMAGDITRTYPVNGAFSAEQKDIYAIVLRAQDEAMKAAVRGALPAQIHLRAAEVIRQGLLGLGLITDARGDQYQMWFTHGAVHYIGIDVHDVGARAHPLEPGVAFTIEPGIYIRESALDALPRTPDNLALIDRIRPAVRKYADIGIRIEDSFLLEESGLTRLSAAVPRTIDEVEAFMRGASNR
jgi:Xaa-Pro aminopeptidase